MPNDLQFNFPTPPSTAEEVPEFLQEFIGELEFYLSQLDKKILDNNPES